jgi:hypothetical protein
LVTDATRFACRSSPTMHSINARVSVTVITFRFMPDTMISHGTKYQYYLRGSLRVQ